MEGGNKIGLKEIKKIEVRDLVMEIEGKKKGNEDLREGYEVKKKVEKIYE